MQSIDESKHYRFSFLHLGFRPFFLLGSIFAFASMSVWFVVYQYNYTLPMVGQISATNWHAHEMIFGYTLAIIAGFLLTAVKNWTGVQTLNGVALLALTLLWLLARCMPFVGHPYALNAMAGFDLTFNLFLVLALLHPIAKAKQWKQLVLWLVIVCLFISNSLFYLGVFNFIELGVSWGITSSLYLILGLIALMGRRVIPFFIEKGVTATEPVSLVNHKWLDISSPIILFIFILFEVFLPHVQIASISIAPLLALLLFFLHAIRIKQWYLKGIWEKPLLWILYIAYAWIVIGFALKFLSLFFSINTSLSIHAFTFGAIGLMTLGMMARVALGHTGRNVFEPPAILKWIFVFAVLGSITRVFLPMLFPSFYLHWIGLSQLLWLASFGLFVIVYAAMLIKPRVDGKYG